MRQPGAMSVHRVRCCRDGVGCDDLGPVHVYDAERRQQEQDADQQSYLDA